MTVAVSVKVNDGIVLAADSATTMFAGNGHQVWNNANKVFELHRSLPIGGMCWGLGAIGNSSIETLAKDFRRRLMGLNLSFLDWEIDSNTYTLEAVANRFVEMFFDELYQPIYDEPWRRAVADGDNPNLILGFLIAGYSSQQEQAESWLVVLDTPEHRPNPVAQFSKDSTGWVSYAQPEAVERLFNGADGNLKARIAAATSELPQDELVLSFEDARRSPVANGMPFADAINLARYMVDVTIGYSTYLFGPNTVGGPVDVAAISRHEGFKWVSRKHYYSADLNQGR